MDIPTLERILQKFWSDHGRSTEFYLGKCADFAWALNEFLKRKGEFFLVGKISNNWATHIVLRWNGVYWDVRGMYPDAKAVNQATPSAAFNGDRLDKAGHPEIQHILSLLHPDFVQSTIDGLHEAERQVTGRIMKIKTKETYRRRKRRKCR